MPQRVVVNPNLKGIHVLLFTRICIQLEPHPPQISFTVMIIIWDHFCKKGSNSVLNSAPSGRIDSTCCRQTRASFLPIMFVKPFYALLVYAV